MQMFFLKDHKMVHLPKKSIPASLQKSIRFGVRKPLLESWLYNVYLRYFEISQNYGGLTHIFSTERYLNVNPVVWFTYCLFGPQFYHLQNESDYIF